MRSGNNSHGQGHGIVRLHLGCGMTRQEGWINCDYLVTQYADLVFDVQRTWPFPDNSVHEIYASHMLEHLADFNTFFEEAWRVLHPNGQIVLRLPHGHHRAAWWDVEHVRPWFAESFAFLQPGYADSIRNPQHSARTALFGIDVVCQRVSGKFAPILRWKIGRHLLLPWLDNITNALEELYFYGYALKDQDAIDRYQARNPGYSVPSQYTIYQHDFDGVALKPNDAVGCTMIPLADMEQNLIFAGYARPGR